MGLFEQILNTNIINFLIVLWILTAIIKKVRVADLIKKMAEDIEVSVDKSAMDAKNAIDEYKTTKRSVRDTAQIQEEILHYAKRNVVKLKDKIEKNTVLAQEEIEGRLEKVYQNQKDRYTHLTINDVYKASIDLAQEEVIKRMDEKAHRRMIKTAINAVEKFKGKLFWRKILI